MKAQEKTTYEDATGNSVTYNEGFDFLLNKEIVLIHSFNFQSEVFVKIMNDTHNNSFDSLNYILVKDESFQPFIIFFCDDTKTKAVFKSTYDQTKENVIALTDDDMKQIADKLVQRVRLCNFALNQQYSTGKKQKGQIVFTKNKLIEISKMIN